MRLQRYGSLIGLAGLCAAILTLGAAPSAVAQVKRRATAPVQPAKQAAPVMDRQSVAEARQTLDNNLLDYPRARFRTVRLVQSTESFKAFCGDINVTNRMGGYNGWHAFVLPLGDSAMAGLYDKPTIQGQPTKMASFFNTYGEAKVEGDAAGRLIEGACGSEAKPLDQVDYAAALTFKSGE